jgi:hypothetical protein
MSLHAIDTAIGIVFVYLLLTLLSSVIVELISSIASWRAQMLHDAVSQLVAGDEVSVDELYGSPYIRSLERVRAPCKGEGCEEAQPEVDWPSYIPATAFSTALLAALWERCRTDYSDLPSAKPEATVEALSDYAEAKLNKNSALRSLILTTTALQGPSVQAVRLSIERWYNDAMDRVTGWYKRRVRGYLLALGILGALAGNVNSLALAHWLWTSDDARRSLVSTAVDYAKSRRPPEAGSAPGAMPPGTTTDAAFAGRMQQFATDFNTATGAMTAYQLPVGWSVRPPEFLNWVAFIQYLVGCLVTGIAISVGSTFWFDALQTLIQIRSTGPRPSS